MSVGRSRSAPAPTRRDQAPHRAVRSLTHRRAGGIPAIADLQSSLGNQALGLLLSAAGGRRRLQRWPGEAMDRARAKVAAEREFYLRTAQLEPRLGLYLSSQPIVNEVADDLLGRLKRVVDAWAEATRQTRTDVYGTAFAFPDGQKYYGSFKATGTEIQSILDHISRQPLRAKLNLLYYATRGNAFATWLETAALEVCRAHDRAGATLEIDERTKGATRTVQPGFAERSGFAEMWARQATSELGEGDLTPEQIAAIVEERMAPGERPLVGVFSKALSSQAPTDFGRPHKVYDKSIGLDWKDQPTLTRREVPDVTLRELKLLYERKGRDPGGRTELEWEQKRARYLDKPDKPVRWEMGVGNIEVLPASDTRRIAQLMMARIDAGISGSADLMMHAALHLGFRSSAEKAHLRLALVAWMLANRDHSLVEILTACAGYGVPFFMDQRRPGSEYEYPDNFAPLPAKTVKEFRFLLPDHIMPSDVLAPTAIERRARAAERARRVEGGPVPDETKLLGDLNVASRELERATPAAFVAHHEALTRVVDRAAFGGADSEEGLVASRRALQALREDPSFHWLAVHHAGDATYAERELDHLVRRRHARSLVSWQWLVAARVPAEIALAATTIQRLDLARLVLAAKAVRARGGHDPRAELRTTLQFQAVARNRGGPRAEKVLEALISTGAKL